MECFIPIKLSESQRPVFMEGELEVLMQDQVGIYDGEQHTAYHKGSCTLTSHRLIWITDDYPRQAVALYHTTVDRVELHTAGMLSFGHTPKLSIHLRNHSANIRLGFKSSREKFLDKYKSALQNKAWEKDTTPVQKQQQSFSTTSAGVGGLMRTITKNKEDTEKTLSQAFTDSEALLRKAKDLVALADKFASMQKESGEEGTAEEQEFRDFLVSMGIVSPVTKKNAGSLYHTELARQLSDWLISRVLPKTPMVQLTDMYCLFNRARGSELISTEDLYRSCVLFDDLNLPVRLRKFESGVLVVQAASQTEDAIAQSVKKQIEEHGPLSAMALSTHIDISPALALEQLQTAEKLEYLCRDETFAGVVFYVNIFPTM